MPVRISGNVQGALSPGVSSPIDLKLMNSTSHTVKLHRIRVKITTLTAPSSDAAHPCTRLDFQIRQMPHLTLRIRGGRTVDLSRLGVPTEKWPSFGMRNRPVNQDGCMGAHLTLGYKALGAWHR